MRTIAVQGANKGANKGASPTNRVARARTRVAIVIIIEIAPASCRIRRLRGDFDERLLPLCPRGWRIL